MPKPPELTASIGTATLPVAVMSRQQAARYEFVASLRMHNGTRLASGLRQVFAERVAGMATPPSTADEAGAVVSDEPIYRFNRFLFQQVQRLTWDSLEEIEPLVRDRVATNRAVAGEPLGTLRLDPAFELPRYYAAAEYHLQPGSYWNSELLHVMARYAGPGIFIPGNVKGILDHLSPALPVAPRRILDVGTGAGRTAVCWLDRWPEADVYGIDVAANLLQDAHATAERLSKPVHYSQQTAEHTDFPDGWFDLVTLYTLQHEVPPAPMAAIIREMFRICAPGGRIINGDVAPHRHMPPLVRHLREWEVDHFGEPYVAMAGNLDLPQLLTEAGFVDIEERAPDNFPNGLDFPWLTWADKPAP